MENSNEFQEESTSPYNDPDILKEDIAANLGLEAFTTELVALVVKVVGAHPELRPEALGLCSRDKYKHMIRLLHVRHALEASGFYIPNEFYGDKIRLLRRATNNMLPFDEYDNLRDGYIADAIREALGVDDKEWSRIEFEYRHQDSICKSLIEGEIGKIR